MVDPSKQLMLASQEIDRLKQWVNDLQSGMYVNCVYCGHRYGPEDGINNMQDALTAHVEQCPKHPLSKTKAENEAMRSILKRIMAWAERPGVDLAAPETIKDWAKNLIKDGLEWW